MFVKGGEPLKAVRLLGEKQPAGWAKQLADIAVDLPAHDVNRPVLLQCASYLAAAGEDAHAKKVYMKLDAVPELMQLYISRQKWPEAIALADDPANKGKFDASIFIPYAEWLALNDQFDAALVRTLHSESVNFVAS
jgi:intraflagellar transport protein 122